MFDYTDTEFRFIEYYNRNGKLTLESLEVERFYYQIIEYKLKQQNVSIENILKAKKLEYVIVSDTIAWIENKLEEQRQKSSQDFIYYKNWYDRVLDFFTAKQIRLSRELERDGISLEIPKIEKLKWNGTPALFGHIMSELVIKCHIEAPMTNKQESISKLARICMGIFDINTTVGNLQNELNPLKNTLSENKKSLIKIENISEFK